jgi:hypothetical protein
MGRRALVAIALGGAALAGCRSDAVSLGFDPPPGSVYRYRYEIEATVTRRVDGGDPAVTEVSITISSEQEIRERTDDGVVASVTLTAEGSAPRTSTVRLDRAGSLEAIQEVEGLPSESVGLPSEALFGTAVGAPPPEDLTVGERWPIEAGSVSGEGRLDRLGVVDGGDVAVATIDLVDAITDIVAVGGSEVALEGEVVTAASTTFDLEDGAVREAQSRTSGTVGAQIAPPTGIDATPVAAVITFELRVRTIRLR